MSKIYPFSYVNLGSFWVIKVDPEWQGIHQPGVLCIGSSGLFETGTAIEAGVDRVYRDGTVLPKKNIISGKRFSMRFYFYGSRESVFLKLRKFQDFVMRNVFDIKTSHGSIHKCRGQQVVIENEYYTESGMTMEISLDIVSSEPEFSFLY